MAQRHLLESDGQAPDAGLARIAAGFAAQAGPAAAGAAVEGAVPSAAGAARVLPAGPDEVWLLELPPGSVSAAGTIDIPDWGPPPGWAWRLTAVTCVFGAGCTLVTLYRDSSLGAASMLFQATSSGVWEPAHRYLANGERLVAVTNGACVVRPDGQRIGVHFLPTYLA